MDLLWIFWAQAINTASTDILWQQIRRFASGIPNLILIIMMPIGKLTPGF
jgi:hypothetical protein